MSMMLCQPLLSVSLVAPGFAAAGAALAVVPILIHIFNRRRHRIVDFAAMHLLLLAVRKNRKRLRFENWLLLGLRCLMIILLGLALSRPMGCDKGSFASIASHSGLHVFIIDNSFALAYREGQADGATQLERAKIAAGKMIDGLSSGESVAIIAAAKPVNANPNSTYDLQQAKASLNRISQCYGNADLLSALQRAQEIGKKESPDVEKHLYIFSGSTCSEWQSTDGPAIRAIGPVLAKSFAITHFNMAIGPQSNQAIVDLYPASNLMTTRAQFGSSMIARSSGFGTSRDASLQWRVDGQLVPEVDHFRLNVDDLSPAQSQVDLHTALTTGTGGGFHAITASLQNDDNLPLDNTRSRVINVLSQLKTLIVEGEHQAGVTGGSGLNLRIALAGLNKSGETEGLAAPELISDLELGDRALSAYQAVILCAVSQVTPSEADQIQTFVKQGGTLMIFAGENISSENYNAQLLTRNLIPGPLVNRVTADEGKCFYFDFSPDSSLHPLLQAFSHQQNSGLETAQIFGYWRIDAPNDPQLRVLNYKAHDVDGTARTDPAITSHALGRGRVVFISTSANEQWITFTRKPIYTELVNELLTGSVNADDAWMNLTVDDQLSIPSTKKFAALPTLTDPKSNPIAVEWVRPSGDTQVSLRSARLSLPGIYTFTTGTDSLPIAVNVPAEASNVRTIEPAALKGALGDIDLQLHDGKALVIARASAGNDWEWTILLMVLAATVAESLAAMRFGHGRKT